MGKLEKDESQSEFTVLIEKYRVQIEVNKQLQLFALIAVLAKANDEAFIELYESTKPNLRANLEKVVNEHLTTMMLASFMRETIETVPEDLIQELVYFVFANKDFLLLADLIHSAYSAQRGAYRLESSTSGVLAKALVNLAGDFVDKVVYDGAAGLCVTTSKMTSAKLVLEDINMESTALGESALFLKGIKHEYYCNDSLSAPRVSVKADVAVSQPPFGLRLSTDQLARIEKSKLLQFAQGEKLPRSAADALWIQQALYHTNETGKALLLLPQGWMFRGGYDAKLREFLINNDLIETIITLPSGLLGFSNVPSVILKLNKSKSKEQRNRVCFVDASQIVNSEKNGISLTDHDIEKILELTNDVGNGSAECAWVKLPEIYRNACNLSIGLYVQQDIIEEYEDLEEETYKLMNSHIEFNIAKDRFEKAMNIKLSSGKRKKQ